MDFRLTLKQCAELKSLMDDTVTDIMSTAKRIITHFHHSPSQVHNLAEEAIKHYDGTSDQCTDGQYEKKSAKLKS